MKRIFLAALLSCIFFVQGFTQSLEEGYDRRERLISPFEEEEAEQKQEKVNEIINRIRKGDRTVLRLIVFDTFESVHGEVLNRTQESGRSYYDILGGVSSLSAYIGGFDNQDPKVRLKVIGYLGDWVDEVGRNQGMIERSVDRRLATNIETRKEVRYAYRVLKMKIVRRRLVSQIKSGNEKILIRISPEEFLPLVFYEPRIRTIYLGSPGAVRIRSILLDPGVNPETGELISERPGRAEGLDLERICYQAVRVIGDQGEVAQWLQDVQLGGGSATDAARSGGFVGGGSLGTTQVTGDIASRPDLDWKCVKSIFGGIDNKSLFVREHSARIFLNYIRGFSGDPNYMGRSGGDPSRVVHPELVKMSRNPYYVRLAQVSWDNVKWSEFNYNDRVTDSTNLISFISMKNYLEHEYSSDSGEGSTIGEGSYRPGNTMRYFTEDASSFSEWGTEKTGNYRNDVKEILRILGISWYLDTEYVQESVPTTERSSLADSLFGDDERSDELEGEANSN